MLDKRRAPTRYALHMTALRIRYVEGVNPSRWFAVWDERHPDAPLDQLRVSEAAQFDDVLSGEADLAIVRGEVEDARLHRVRLFEERAVAVAVREHPLEAFEELTLADLDGEALLDGDELSAEDTVAVAATGAGIAILPMSVARLYGAKNVIARPLADVPGYDVSLVWLRDRDDDDVQDFVGITRGRRATSSRGGDSEVEQSDRSKAAGAANKSGATRHDGKRTPQRDGSKRNPRPTGARGSRRKPSRPKRRR